MARAHLQQFFIKLALQALFIRLGLHLLIHNMAPIRILTPILIAVNCVYETSQPSEVFAVEVYY